jgi:hypothetical protein
LYTFKESLLGVLSLVVSTEKVDFFSQSFTIGQSRSVHLSTINYVTTFLMQFFLLVAHICDLGINLLHLGIKNFFGGVLEHFFLGGKSRDLSLKSYLDTLNNWSLLVMVLVNPRVFILLTLAVLTFLFLALSAFCALSASLPTTAAVRGAVLSLFWGCLGATFF